jgi:hypothetical protein
MQTSVIPAYIYNQYFRDEVDEPTQLDISAIFDTINANGQEFIDWFNTVNLPVYTGLSGSLLDWVANGLYGFKRPTLANGDFSPSMGTFGTLTLGGFTFGYYTPSITPDVLIATDDTFKRVLTWHLYKADGKNFNVRWLKRRIARFIGLPENETYPIAITLPIRPPLGGLGTFGTLTLGGFTFGYYSPIDGYLFRSTDNTIVIDITTDANTLPLANILKFALKQGVIETPFNYTFTVNIL